MERCLFCGQAIELGQQVIIVGEFAEDEDLDVETTGHVACLERSLGPVGTAGFRQILAGAAAADAARSGA